MSAIDIRFVGAANFAQPRKEIALLQKDFAELQAQMQAASRAPMGTADPVRYRNAAKATSALSTAFRDAAASTGLFESSQHKINSQTQEYVRLLQKQKLGLKDILTQMPLMKAAYHEQLRLQRSYITGWQRTGSGQLMADLIIPKDIPRDLDNIRNRWGMVGSAIQSASQQTINWGKNTQWAGRQLMVGFTMPLLAFGAATGVLAYQVDKNLTRVAKVYDTTVHEGMSLNQQMMASERELAQVRSQSSAMATTAAQSYGSAVNDTLDAEAQLAATGLKGADLMRTTSEVMRIAMLGEMDYNDAINASIALQTTFRLSTEELTEAFNYMNAVENATSLQLVDFAQAIPIAAGPIKQMGGDIKTLGEFLVAMRENGIGAVQGANAIKSAMQRLYRPSKQIQEEFKAIAGASIIEIRDRNKGDIRGMLTDIAELTEDMDRAETVQLLGGLFGTYQVTRLTALLNGIRDMEEGIGQVHVAQQLAGESAKELATRAEYERLRLMSSASGQFKAALESLKIELAEMGQPFLEAGASFLHLLAGAVAFFNSLPDGAKKVIGISAVFIGLLGPTVMLTGLFANMMGTIAKGVGWMLTLATRFKLINSEQRIAAAMAELSTSATQKQTSATQALTMQVNALTASLEGAIAAQQAYAGAAMRGPLQFSPTAGGMVPGLPQVALPGRGRHLDDATDVVAESGEKARRSWTGAGVAMGASVAAMGVMASTSNETADNIAEWVMYLSIATPMLFAMKAPIRDAMIALNAGLASAATKSKVLMASMSGASLRATAGGAATGVMSFLKGGGGAALGVAAAAGGAYLLWQNYKHAADEAKNLYSDTEALAGILGYTAAETEHIISGSGATIEAQTDKVAKFREEYGTVVDRIIDAKGEQNKLNVAMTQGLKVINTGGTAEQAREAVLMALRAAGEEAKDYTVEFKTELDFTNVDNLVNAWANQGSLALTDAINTQTDFSAMETIDLGLDWLQKPGDPRFRISQLAEENGREAGTAFGRGFQQALEPQQRESMATSMLEQFASIPNSEIRRVVAEGFVEQFGMAADSVDGANASVYELLNTVGLVTPALAEHIRQWKMQNGEASFMDNILSGIYTTTQDIKNIHASTDIELASQNSKLQKQQQLLADMRTVFKNTDWKDMLRGNMEDIQSGFADTMTDAFDDEMDAIMERMEDENEARLADFDRQQEMMQRSHERETRRLENRHEAQQRELDREQEREQARFEARWERRHDKVEGVYDARIEGIEKEIDAEERADAIRQRLYERELQRIQRLADAQNRQIDFSMAMRSGDLDEAARIRNDAAAAVESNALEDAADRAGRGTERRVNRLQKLIDATEEERDKRIKAIEEIEEKERRSLERRLERETRFLENRQEAEQRALEATQRAEERSLERSRERYENWYEHQRDMRQDWIDGEKKKWDRALDALQSYIPTSRRDLFRHIQDVKGEYRVFGDFLEGRGSNWAEIIGRELHKNVRESANALRSDINWEGIAIKSARAWASALGISLADFKKMMGLQFSTGKGKNDVAGRRHRRPNTFGDVAPTSLHSGGPAWEGRTGYPRSASPYPSEHLRLLRNDEYVVDGRTHRKLGTGFFDSLKTQAQMSHHDGGAVGMPLGMAGMTAAVFAKSVEAGIQKAVRGAAPAMGGGYGAARAGEYGLQDIFFGNEQLRNAQIIASVGRGMGMSRRDIAIGIMTAITESMLRNVQFGDRDSLGLFQQRPSQGWGSADQVTNPEYAARKFFASLKAVGDRGKMAPWMAAQTVQRSAYADGSNYRIYWDEARDILNSMRMVTNFGTGIHMSGNASDRSMMDGEPVSKITKAQILLAEKLSGRNISVMQGSWQPYTSYSGSSHMGPGVVDTSPGNWIMQSWLRKVGFAAWARNIPGAGYAGSGAHIHAVSLLDPGARSHSQIASYRAGGDGLGGRDYGPNPGMLPGLANMLPKFASGGFALSDGLAALHGSRSHPEAVLSAPMTEKFERGVDNFANGGNSEYNFHIYPSPGMDTEQFARKVAKIVHENEKKTGRRRRVIE